MQPAYACAYADNCEKHCESTPGHENEAIPTCKISCSRVENYSCITQQVRDVQKAFAQRMTEQIVLVFRNACTRSWSRRLKTHTLTHTSLISIPNSICRVYWVSTRSNSLYNFFNLQMHFTRSNISSEVNTNWDIRFQICPEQELPDIRCKHTFIHFFPTHTHTHTHNPAAL